MKLYLHKYTFIFSVLVFVFYMHKSNATNLPNNTSTISFKENKGQVSDQFYKPRPDVLFSGTDGKLVFHLKKNGISYQLSRVDSWKKQDTFPTRTRNNIYAGLLPSQRTTYRLDINWLNSNTNSVIRKDEVVEGYDNYYNEVCPQGALNVKSYKQITYQQLYNGIDLKWYEKNGNLKYDYILAAGADYKKIQLEFNGAEKISINKNGELIIKTPLGELTEAAPYVLQNGKQLIAKWIIANKIVSFDIKNVDPSQSLIIDPLVRLWGTYYGGSNYDSAGSSYSDALGNVFLCGGTASNNALTIATLGAHQTVYGGAGANNTGDAFLVKFTSSGLRLWGTYYGGTGDDAALGCWVNSLGEIYLTGATSSTNTAAISTPGCHQPFRGGGLNVWQDAFLAKFNSSGVRQWGTYFGGDDIDMGGIVIGDNLGNVYMTGYSNSTNPNVIATPGSHQTTNGGNGDGFLAKFDGTGLRLWSTYYGGEYPDVAASCVLDASGNIYMVGSTNSTISIAIATPGSHQPTYGGGTLGGILHFGDGYLVKFNSSGVRQWGTYYGGSNQEYISNCTIDAAGDIYFSGMTTSIGGTSIATASSHQSNYGGGSSDAMLVKFNSAGIRQWGTYYGGAGKEDYSSCECDNLNGYVYFPGMTSSSSGTVIATPCTYQDVYGGGLTDAFLAKFTVNGLRVWGTYYGGSGNDDYGCGSVDAFGNVYLVGETSSTGTVIASSNGHQQNNGGGTRDVFLVKFDGCKPPPNTTPPTNQIICLGKSTTLTSTLGCGITWFNTIGGSPIGTGSVISVAPVNTTTFYIDDVSCGLSNSPTVVSVTVVPSITVSISANNTLVCSGNPVNIISAGAPSYTWLPGNLNTTSITINPIASITQTVIGSNGTCNDTATIFINVIPYPNLSVNLFPNQACSGSTVNLSANGAQSYTWFPSNNLTSTGGSLVTSVPLFTNSTFSLTGENSSGTVSCLSQTILTVNVIPSFTSQVSNSVTICSGDNTSLSAGGGNTYNWFPVLNINSPNQQTIIANPTVSTVYSVAISFNNLCPVTQTVFVNVNPKPFVNAGQDTIINMGDPLILSASGNGTFKWVSSEVLSCYDCRIAEVILYAKSCFTVQLIDQNGCKAQDEVCVDILNDFGVYIPNSFTPNNDGKNDVFKVNYYGIKEIKLNIYDRWGSKIFYTEDQNGVWDGSFRSKACQVDTYIYHLDYIPERGKQGSKTGHVNIIR